MRKQPFSDNGRVCGCAMFLPRGLHEEALIRTIGLQVDSSGECASHHEREAVVAELPLFLGGVDLDPIVEVKHPLRTRAEPDNRIEWGEQCVGGKSRGEPRVPMHPRWLGRAVLPDPPSDSDGMQNSSVLEGPDRQPGIGGRESVVVREVCKGGYSQSLSGTLHELTLCSLARNLDECRSGKDLFSECVASLKPYTPVGDNFAAGKHHLDRSFGITPIPPGAPRFPGALLEFSNELRPSVRKHLSHPIDHRPKCGGSFIARVPHLEVLHAPSKERSVRDWDECGLVCPVLGELTAFPELPIKCVAVVDPLTREDREIVAAGKDIDRIDLQYVHPLESGIEGPPHSAASRSVETLCRQCDTTGF